MTDCIHKGPIRSQGVLHGQPLTILACSQFGKCALQDIGATDRDGQAFQVCNESCPKRLVPTAPTSGLIAPTRGIRQDRPWNGPLGKKPWDYQVTACIPHLDTPEQLEVCVAVLRAQSIKPYIIVIDTGSLPENRERIEAMRADDLEVHYILGHGWRHPSEPVAVACQLAQDRCQTEWIFHTHSDCFLMSQTLLEDWIKLAEEHVVVGYQISPRPYDGWQEELGHTALMMHNPTVIAAGVTWSMSKYCTSVTERCGPSLSGVSGNIASLGKNVWIGNYRACDSVGSRFSRVIHIRHDSQPGHCRCLDAGLQINWKEHEPLDDRWLVDAWECASEPSESLLVHCAAGLGRSAHFAALSLVARGQTLPAAVAMITEAMLVQYGGEVPNWDRDTLKQIYKFAESRAKPLLVRDQPKFLHVSTNRPDTESEMNAALSDAGIVPLMLGTEENRQRNTNEHFDHVRSIPSTKQYDQAYYSRMQGELKAAMIEARQRVEQWTGRQAQLQSTFPCVHRGEVSRIDEQPPCKGGPATIYQCDLHAECSITRYCTGQKVRACSGCKDRSQLVQLEMTVAS